MKIAFIVNLFPAFSETFILNQITALIDRGHDVDIFAYSNPNHEVVHGDVDAYGLMERTHYYGIPPNRGKRALSALRLLLQNFHRDPVRMLRSLNILKFKRDAYKLKLIHALASFIRADKDHDILMCHFGMNGNLGARLKQLDVKGKLVTMFHLTDIQDGIEKGGQIYSNLFEQGDCFLAISDYNYKHLVEFGLDLRKIIYHPGGVDLEKFTYHRPLKWPAELQTLKILTVARLADVKGLRFSIEAIDKIRTQNLDLRLEYSIIGGGPLKEDLEKLIHNLGLNDVVYLFGPGEQEQVIRAMQENHIFVLPSLGEALPVVLMEAQAVGLPIIATSVGSVDQAIVHGDSGFLVPPGNVDALVERIQYMIDHPQDWLEMGRVGRKFVEEFYDIDKLNRRLVNVYQALIRGELEDLQEFVPPSVSNK